MIETIAQLLGLLLLLVAIAYLVGWAVSDVMEERMGWHDDLPTGKGWDTPLRVTSRPTLYDWEAEGDL